MVSSCWRSETPKQSQFAALAAMVVGRPGCMSSGWGDQSHLDRRGIILGALPENAAVFSWRTAASMRIGCSVSVWASPQISDRRLPKPVLAMSLPGLPVPRPYHRALVPLPASNAALNSREQSEGNRSSIPSVSGNRPDSIRAVWRYVVAAFCPGSRNPGRPHNHDVPISAPTSQE